MMFWTLLAAVCISLSLTSALRRYALTRRSLIDVPNERSSHQLPTPRGGGVAIAISFLGLLPALWISGALPSNLLVALMGAGGLIALVGFLDDRRPMPVAWRFAAHCVAAAWVVAWRTLHTVHGQPSWLFRSSHVHAHLTRLGGHLGPVAFRLEHRLVSPFSVRGH